MAMRMGRQPVSRGKTWVLQKENAAAPLTGNRGENNS